MSKGEKKKDSTLSVISCILAGVALIEKFAYEITKVHVYIWQLPRGNIGGIMMKTN